MRSRSRKISLLIPAAVSLFLGAAAIASSSWLSRPPAPEEPLAATSRSDPVAGPTEVANGPLSRTVGDLVADLPELKSLRDRGGFDLVDDNLNAGVAHFYADDGAKIEFIVQQLSGPVSKDAVGPPEEIRYDTRPGGVELIVRETDRFLQVVAVNPQGVMANVIVERTVPGTVREPSDLSGIDSDTVIQWAIYLVQEVEI